VTGTTTTLRDDPRGEREVARAMAPDTSRLPPACFPVVAGFFPFRTVLVLVIAVLLLEDCPSPP
jgi:hypothetical protein